MSSYIKSEDPSQVYCPKDPPNYPPLPDNIVLKPIKIEYIEEDDPPPVIKPKIPFPRKLPLKLPKKRGIPIVTPSNCPSILRSKYPKYYS
jgi:hypothetical protein